MAIISLSKLSPFSLSLPLSHYFTSPTLSSKLLCFPKKCNFIPSQLIKFAPHLSSTQKNKGL